MQRYLERRGPHAPDLADVFVRVERPRMARYQAGFLTVGTERDIGLHVDIRSVDAVERRLVDRCLPDRHSRSSAEVPGLLGPETAEAARRGERIGEWERRVCRVG